MPPITSTIRSASARISAKSPRERVSTPPSTGRRPLKRSISSARSSSSVANAPPTVPCPSRPTRNGTTPLAPRGLADIARRELLHGLAPDDHARVAVAHEDHRRPRDPVVVVGHRVTVGAGDRRDDHIARPGVVEQRVGDENVAGLAVLSREHAAIASFEAAGGGRFVPPPLKPRAPISPPPPPPPPPPPTSLLVPPPP